MTINVRLLLLPAMASCDINLPTTSSSPLTPPSNKRCFVVGRPPSAGLPSNCPPSVTMHLPPNSKLEFVSRDKVKINDSEPIKYNRVHIDRPKSGRKMKEGTIFGNSTPPPPHPPETPLPPSSTLIAGVSTLSTTLTSPPSSKITYLSSHPLHLFHLHLHTPTLFLTTVPSPIHGLLKSLLKQSFKERGVDFKVAKDQYVRYVVNEVKNEAKTGDEVEIEGEKREESRQHLAIATSSASSSTQQQQQQQKSKEQNSRPHKHQNNPTDVYTASRTSPEVMHRIPCSNFLYTPLVSHPYGVVSRGSLIGLLAGKGSNVVYKHDGYAIGADNVTVGDEGVEVTGEVKTIWDERIGGCYVGGECGKELDCYYQVKDGVGLWYYTMPGDEEGRVTGAGVLGFDVKEEEERGKIIDAIGGMVGRRVKDVDGFGVGEVARFKVRRGGYKGRYLDEVNGFGRRDGGEGREDWGGGIKEEVFMTDEDIRKWRTKGDAWWGSYNKEVYGGGRKDGWGKWLYR